MSSITVQQSKSSSEDVHTNEMASAELKITRKLMEGCGEGDVNVLKRILFDELKKEDAPGRIKKSKDANGKTLLHFAAATGHIPVVEFLMSVIVGESIASKHQTVNAQDNEGATPISTACGAAPDDKVLQVVQLLLDFGADPTITNKNGVGPLHRAAGEGHVDVIALLLDYQPQEEEANDKISTSKGSVRGGAKKVQDGQSMLDSNAGETGTALHWAASEKKVLALQYLIDRGANLNVLNNNGLPPVMVAAAVGSGKSIAILVNAGCETKTTLPGGVTLLHMCAEISDEEQSLVAVSSLLSTRSEHVLTALGSKYEPSAAHPRGLLPVELAAREGNAKVVELLMDSAGNDVEDGMSVQELIAYEQASQKKEKQQVAAARKSGQMVDDGMFRFFFICFSNHHAEYSCITPPPPPTHTHTLQ
jgi:ankyrin repeat protein